MPEVVDHRGRPGLKRRQVLGAGGHREGHPARGRHPPQQHIGQGLPTLLAGVPEQQDRVHPVPPALTEDRATAHQHHHGAGVGGGHRQDQGLLGPIQGQLGAVAGGEVAARAGRSQAGDRGHHLSHRPPEGPQPLAAKPALQGLRSRHLPQDRRQVAGVDVLPLLPPVEPHHHHGGIAGRRQPGSGRRIIALAVVHLELGGSGADPFEGGDYHPRLGAGIGGAPIAEIRPSGQGTDHRQRPPIRQRQHRFGIFEQHDRLGGRLPGQAAVGGAAPQGGWVIAGWHRQLGPQQAQHRVIEALHRQGARRQGFRQATLIDHREGHLQIEPGPQGGQAIAQPEDEIAHHKAAKAPTVFEDGGEQLLVLGTPVAIHAVVGGHHRAGPGGHTVAEVGEIELMEHPAAHPDIHQEAGTIDRVEGEMLDAGDGVALQAAAAGSAHGPEKHGILAVGLLGPAPAGVAQQVHTHRRHPVGTKRAGLPGDGLADPLLQVDVPAGAPGDRHGKGGGAPLQHHPPRTIDKLQPLQAVAGQHPGRPGMAVGGIGNGDVDHAGPEGGGARKEGEFLGRLQASQQQTGSRFRRTGGGRGKHGVANNGAGWGASGAAGAPTTPPSVLRGKGMPGGPQDMEWRAAGMAASATLVPWPGSSRAKPSAVPPPRRLPTWLPIGPG